MTEVSFLSERLRVVTPLLQIQNMKLKTSTIFGTLFLTAGAVFGQQDSTDQITLSLEELMNIEIVSASKKAENLFDAPLSASVLTREEIKNAGSTSIMEALRLIPGVIVREQTNGNYDIHVRGLDNVPPNSLILSSTNTTTLVMINNRPVYNYLQGGTFWESLPIDLNDVERIEVVRGPSSTLYGPNAVSGVINIITTRSLKKGFNVNGSAQYGSLKTSIANATVGYKFNDKLDLSISGNTQIRGRESNYLNTFTQTWVDSPKDLAIDNPNERYPHPDKSMIKYGVNTVLNYTANDKLRLAVAAGLQDSEVQGITFDNSITNVSTTLTNSKYVDVQASTFGLNTQLAYTTAIQSPVVGMTGSKYDYQITDFSTEYEFNINGFAIKPGITYRSAVYDDRTYWENGEGTLGGRRIMETIGGGVRFDYTLLNEKLRLTSGIRMDKFTHPGKWFTSYQAAASYKVNAGNMVRLVYSKAYRSPFIFDTFINYTQLAPLSGDMYTQYVVTGNKELSLLHSNMIELGYRTKLRSNISADLEGYYTRTENYSALIQNETTPTPENYPVVATTSLSTQNIPLQVEQLGATLSMTMVFDNVQIKPFVTVQKTTLNDYSPYFSTTNAAPSDNNGNDPANNNVNSGKGSSTAHKFTPKAYGGLYVNYSISSKFVINVNTYWFSSQTFFHMDNIKYNDGKQGVENINGKLIANAKIQYLPVDGVSIFVNGKNLLNKTSREYYRSDETPAMVLGGVSFNF